MFKIAALAYLPINAVLFGFMSMLLAIIPGLTRDFGTAATMYYGAAALSFILAAPLSYLAARRMLSRRERRRLDKGEGGPR